MAVLHDDAEIARRAWSWDGIVSMFRDGKERKEKERKGKERKGKERKGKEKGGGETYRAHSWAAQPRRGRRWWWLGG